MPGISIGDAMMRLGVDKGDWDSSMQKLNSDMQQFQDKAKETSMATAELTKAAVGLMAVGAGLSAVLGMGVKAAAEEEQILVRLKTAMENVGTSYADNEEELKNLIYAMSEATAYSDEELYNAMVELVNITGNYKQSLSVLPLTLDLAAAKSLSLSTASMLIGRVATGNTELLTRYGIQLEKGATAEEALAIMTERFAGQAEAMGQTAGGSFQKVSNAVGDLTQVFGYGLMPVAKLVADILERIIRWYEGLNPLLKNAITYGIAFAAALALLLGGYVSFMLLAPKVQAAWAAINAVMAANPIGIVIAAVTALATAAMFLWQNWEAVAKFFSELWRDIKSIFAQAIKFITNTILLPWVEMIGKTMSVIAKGIAWIVNLFNGEAADAIYEFSDKLWDARDELSKWADSVVESVDAEKAFEKLQEQVAEYSKKRLETIKEELDKERQATRQAYDDRINAIKKEYGTYERATKNKMQLAKEASDKAKDAIDKEMDAVRDSYDEKFKLLEREKEAKEQLYDEDTQRQLDAIQYQIDEIDRAQEVEDRMYRAAQDAKREAELQAAVDSAETAEDYESALEDLREFRLERDREALRQAREDEKDSLRTSMEAVKKAREQEKKNQEAIWQAELDAQRANLQSQLDAELDTLARKKEALDIALEEELERLNKERIQKEEDAKKDMEDTLALIDKKEEFYKAFYENQELQVALYVQGINDELAKIQDKTVTVTIVTERVETGAGATSWSPPTTPTPVSPYTASPALTHYQGGGVIPEPTLLYGLSRRGFYGMAGEAGTEHITPGGRAINVFVELEGRTLVKAMGQPLVDEIRIKTGRRI